MKETMNSRERIYKALAHEEADRYPIDLGMHFSTGISIFAYHKLRKFLGLSTDRIELVDTVQLLARVDEDILKLFHCDTILLNPPYKKPVVWNVRDDYRFLVPEQWLPTMENGYWTLHHGNEKMRLPPGGFFFDGTGWYQAKDYDDEENLKVFCREAERLYRETDKFTCLMGEFCAFFTGLDMACDMLTDPESVVEKQEINVARNIDAFNFVNAHIGKYIQAIELNSDLGMQSGPMLSPEMYEKYCMPYLKRFCDHVHNTSDIKTFLHSCGSVEKLLPYIIEGGIDILNPVQVSAADMNPKLLKAKYGSKICFWGGGCDTQ
ncbi:MAG: hypothetical protein FWF29_04860, partial [Treponema sp.]|nr:hypothetical protein [Treponema sp.]